MRRKQAEMGFGNGLHFFSQNLLILVFLIFFTAVSSAATINVPSEEPTIQAGIESASSGDTILVAPGTYTEDGNRDIVLSNQTLTILSTDGAENTILDPQGSTSEPHRVFDLLSSSGGQIIIDGFTFTGGYAPANSGIGDTESAGGAISARNSDAIIRNCIFENNTCGMRGGAIYITGGSPQLINCELRNNNVVFDAGALYLYGPTSAVVTNCVFKDNSAQRGGALYSINSSPIFDHCLFANNQASLYGGAGVCYSSTYPDNSHYVNCTFYGNQAVGLGGAIYSYEGILTLDNCIIAFNPMGVAIGCNGSNPIYPILTCCNVYGNVDGDYANCIDDYENENGNISRDPLFCDPANGDFSLSIFSPCHPDSNACGLMGAYDASCFEGQYPIAVNVVYGSEGLSGIVTEPNPQISWTYLDDAATSQTKYEIEIGTDMDWSIAEMWSSGQISSSVTNTVYSGAELANFNYYFIRIRVHNGSEWGNWQSGTFLTHFSNVINVPDDIATIQGAIDMALDGDVVLIATGIYTGEGNRDIELLGKAIVVKSINGPDYTIIDAEGTDEDRHRGFYIHSSEDAATIIEGLTITGGFARPGNTVYADPSGGGIYCYHVSPTIRNCKIINNQSSITSEPHWNGGGGVYCDNSNPVLENCEISQNISSRYGGGMYFSNDCNATLKACVIQDNFAAGIYGGVLTMIDCDILDHTDIGIDCYGADMTNCQVMGNAKGIHTSYGATTITESLFENNTTYGFRCDGAPGSVPTISIDNCRFIDNNVNGLESYFASLAVYSSVFANNGSSAINLGYCGNASFDKCTIVDNIYGDETSKGGSAVQLTFSGMNLQNSIVAFNKGFEPIACVEAGVSAECCDVYGNSGGDWVGCLDGYEGINSNFSSDPLFCDTEQGNYHLQEISPCIMSKKECAEVLGAFEPGCNQTQYVCGDANDDERVNVSDAVYIINYVFNGGLEPEPLESGEVNCDGRVNISDAVYLINYVFSGGHDPCDTNGDEIPDC